MKLFKMLCIVTSLLSLYLSGMLLFNPQSFINDIGLEGNPATFFICRRASLFMLGTALLTFFSRNLVSSQARRPISLSLGVTWLGLSITGIQGFATGLINNGILAPIIIEIIVASGFFYFWGADRHSIPEP